VLAGVDVETIELEWAARRVLSPRQLASVGILCLGVDPPTYQTTARALGMTPSTLKTHLRRVRNQHPVLYGRLMERHGRLLGLRHLRVVAARRRRSQLWGRRRFAAAYRRNHGRWPWENGKLETSPNRGNSRARV
jgi:DNA-binding CsgD family transcriptional regulator